MYKKIGLFIVFFYRGCLFADPTYVEQTSNIVGSSKLNICVVGAGYVGLVSGACFAQQEGNDVVIVEKNDERLAKLLVGDVPFYEQGLSELLALGIKNNRLHFVSSIAQACVYKPHVFFTCVGTPSLADGGADLSDVWGVAREIGKNLQSYSIVVSKSTVPVGTAKKVKSIINDELKKRSVPLDFDVASNPEFLKEGDAIKDFTQPDRVVVGVESDFARQILFKLYKPFLKSAEDFVVINVESSELTKYASNAMLATRISFMMQLARLADNVGADIDAVKLGMAKDRRIGPFFLNAGVGYGGSCFPKDIKALIHTGVEYGHDMTILKEVDHVNNEQRIWFINKILNYYGDQLAQKTVGIWGLAFKPETDDIRCAPSLDVISALIAKGAKVVVYDPQAMDNVKKIFGDQIVYANNAQAVLDVSDFLVLLTEWRDFLDYQHKLSSFLRVKDGIVFDGRNCFDPKQMKHLGIKYFTIGRNSVN